MIIYIWIYNNNSNNNKLYDKEFRIFLVKLNDCFYIVIIICIVLQNYNNIQIYLFHFT